MQTCFVSSDLIRSSEREIKRDNESTCTDDPSEMFDVETDLRQEAQKVISIFQNEARMKRIALSLKLGESIERLGLHAIKTDPVRLGQV